MFHGIRRSQPAWWCLIFTFGFTTLTHADDTMYVESEVGAPGSTVSVSITLDNEALCQGWSAGVCHDPNALSIDEVVTGEDAAALNDGSGPDFNQIQVFDQGFASGVVISFLGSTFLPVGEQFELWEVTYLLGEEITETEVQICGTLGMPPVTPAIVHNGQAILPSTVSGFVTIGVPFRRGDCNDDGGLDLADVIYAEQYLFLSGEVPVCLDACDINDDSLVDLADPITLLNWLFVGGPEPPAPFLECGSDPTSDTVSCEWSALLGCP